MFKTAVEEGEWRAAKIRISNNLIFLIFLWRLQCGHSKMFSLMLRLSHIDVCSPKQRLHSGVSLKVTRSNKKPQIPRHQSSKTYLLRQVTSTNSTKTSHAV